MRLCPDKQETKTHTHTPTRLYIPAGLMKTVISTTKRAYCYNRAGACCFFIPLLLNAERKPIFRKRPHFPRVTFILRVLTCTSRRYIERVFTKTQTRDIFRNPIIIFKSTQKPPEKSREVFRYWLSVVVFHSRYAIASDEHVQMTI